MAGKTTAPASATASGDDADTLAAKRRGDEIYVNGVTAAKEGIAGITNWVKGIFGAGDSSSTAPANATLPDIKNPELKAIAEKLIHYRGILKAYEEKYGSGLDPKKRKDLGDLNAVLFSEAGFNRIMREFARNDLTPAYIKQMTDRFNSGFPQMEALEKEYDVLEDEEKKKKEAEKGKEGFKWSRIAGGGLLGLIGYFVGSIFGGPVGTIVSLMLAVGGFFLGGDMGEKLFGGMFGDKGSASPAAPGQGPQPAQAGPEQDQARARVAEANANRGTGQPLAFTNGMTPEVAQQLGGGILRYSGGAYGPQPLGFGHQGGLDSVFAANQHTSERFRLILAQAGVVGPDGNVPQVVLRHQGPLASVFTPRQHENERQQMRALLAGIGQTSQDFSQGQAPSAPFRLNNFSVQGRDVGFNLNSNGGNFRIRL